MIDLIDSGRPLEHVALVIKPREWREQRSGALAFGTLFFAVVAYWLMAVTVNPASAELVEIRTFLRSILSADAAWFVLLGWLLTSLVFKSSPWPSPVFHSRFHNRFPRACRTIAWQRFRRAFWMALAASLAWLAAARAAGLLEIENPGFEGAFLLREFHLLADPLSSFVLLFVVLDAIRVDLFRQALRGDYAIVMAMLVSLGVEVWVWAEFLDMGFESMALVPLILAVLWGELGTYESLLLARAASFWSRLGVGIGIFTVFNLGVPLLDSPWNSGWSFFVVDVRHPVILLSCAAMTFSLINVAVLRRFSQALTRVG